MFSFFPQICQYKSRISMGLIRLCRNPLFLPSTKQTAILAWGSTGIFAAIVFIWFPLSALRFGPDNYLVLFKAVLILAIGYSITKLVSVRLRQDQSNIAKFIWHYSDGFAILISASVFLIPMANFGTIYMYLAAGMGLPLQDAWLARIDHAIGFDWLAFLQFTNSSPVVSTILVQAYHSAGPQLVALLLFLSLTKRCGRLSEFLAVLAVSSLLTGTVMVFVPAVGAYDYYQPDRQLFDNFTPNAGMWHYDQLMALRSRRGMDFLYDKAVGLVTFPSYHTVLAILTAYTVRDVRLLAAPAVILNAVAIVSTLPEGGHYLIDVLAGFVIALASVFLVRGVSKEKTPNGRILKRVD